MNQALTELRQSQLMYVIITTLHYESGPDRAKTESAHVCHYHYTTEHKSYIDNSVNNRIFSQACLSINKLIKFC